jgi:hypothetical protein
MTTLIIHGTLANGASWYQNSWQGDGFLAGLDNGLALAEGANDIWSLNGAHVSEYNDLGLYEWSGSGIGTNRGTAATELAQYLNTVAHYTDEPIRIIAHSHGCNVVKLASSSPELSSNVYIEQAVFLACPHFYEETYTTDKLPWQDRINIKKVIEANKNAGYFIRYPVNPDKIGRILNAYSERDSVQSAFAETLGGTQPPMSGNFLENCKLLFNHGLTEMPKSSRWEMDERVTYLYENIELQIQGKCSGLKAHSVMHGFTMGQLCGVWLNSGLHIDEIIGRVGAPVLSGTDDGT